MNNVNLIRYSSEGSSGFSFVTYHLNNYNRLEKCSFYFFFGDDEIVCRRYEKMNQNGQRRHGGKKLFSIKYSNIDKGYEEIEDFRCDEKSIINLKEEFRNLICGIYIHKNYYRSREIINFRERIGGSQMDLWAKFQNLKFIRDKTKDQECTIQESFEKEYIKLYKSIVNSILERKKHNDIRDFSLFQNQDEEDLLSEILNFDPKPELNNTSDISGFYLERYNYYQAFRLLENKSTCTTWLSYILLFSGSPIIHLCILVLSVLAFWIRNPLSNSSVFFLIITGTILFSSWLVNKTIDVSKKKWVGVPLCLVFLVIGLIVAFRLSIARTILLYSFSYTVLTILIFPVWFLIIKRNIQGGNSDVFTKVLPSPFIALLSPVLISSIVIGWLLILSTMNDFWSLNSFFVTKSQYFILLMLFLLLLIFFIIYSEIETVKPKIKFWDSIFRIMVLFFKGLPVSLFTGIVLMSMTFPMVIDRSEVYTMSDSLTTRMEEIKAIDELQSQFDEKLLNPVKTVKYKEILSLDTATIFKNECLKRCYLDMSNHLDSMLQCSLSSDSVYVKKKIYEGCKERCITIIKSSINNDLKKLLFYKYEIIKKIAGEESNLPGIPSIMYTGCRELPFIFPRLLVLWSAFSFLIGFFIQFVRTSRFSKHGI